MWIPTGLVACARRLARPIVRLRDVRAKVTLDCPAERLGSAYGGWWVHSGDLGPESVVYSFGVGEDVSFDLELIRRVGCTVHAFDPTPRSIAWARSQPLPPEFVLHEYGLGGRDDVVSFFPPENRAHVSHSIVERTATASRKIAVSVRRLATIMRELGHRHVDLLKMDVEGAEYEVIEDIVSTGALPGQLLVEYHHRLFGYPAARTRRSLALLERVGYRLFRVSESGEEFSLMRVPRDAASRGGAPR